MCEPMIEVLENVQRRAGRTLPASSDVGRAGYLRRLIVADVRLLLQRNDAALAVAAARANDPAKSPAKDPTDGPAWGHVLEEARATRERIAGVLETLEGATR